MESNQLCKENRWYTFLLLSASIQLFGIGSVLLYRLGLKIVKYYRIRKSLIQANNFLWKENPIGETITVTVSSDNFDQRILEQGAYESRISEARLNSAAVMTDSVFTNYSKNNYRNLDWMIEATDWAREIISGQNGTGRILICLVSALSLGSLIIYFIEVSQLQGVTEELCIKWSDSYTQQFDLAFNIVFLIFFCLRWVAATDKFWFWCEIYSIIDVLTVPPAFMTFILNRYWVGLRFTRALRLINFTDVLVFLNVLKSSSKIRLCHLVTLFTSLVLTAAGFIHLIELSVDLGDQSGKQNKTYFDYTYFMIVTMSTVGYGDVVCKTWQGKLMMIFFILGGLAIFANSIPEIIEIIGNRNQYGGVFKKETSKQHIILCGHITYQSVSNFLADFLHKDREDVDVQIVILDTVKPNIELQSVLKRNLNQVQFYLGSVMNTNDLARVQIQHADACLILCDKHSMDPDAEDAANIMRVISIKNYCPVIKVIVQLMQYHNKAYLMNIPSWDWRRGDDVVCVAELKLGFIAQSCLAPGFSTLLANLFVMRSFKKYQHLPEWVNEYAQGSSLEMYTEYLSPSFHGMTFSEAVCVCFTNLNLLLIAVEIKSDNRRNHSSSIAINPKPDVTIEPGTQGFFIADSADDAKKAFYYCHMCHKSCKSIKPCNCQSSQHFQETLYNIVSCSLQMFNNTSKTFRPRKSFRKPEVVLRSRRKRFGGTSTKRRSLNDTINNIKFNEQSQRRFDSTGMFHWCSSRDFESVLLSNKDDLSATVFTDHIVVCIFADSNSPLIGLRNFVMPLRSSNYHYSELRQIIFVGPQDYLRREWKSIMNFPKLFVLNGSPLNRTKLRMVNINLCEMTVILSTNHSNALADAYLADKEAILCSLNIKAMRFSNDNSKSKNLDEIFKNLSNGTTHQTDIIPMITELSVDSSVQYLDQDDEDNPDTELFLTQPFACGRAFAVSVLDSLMSTAYFNENALTLIRTMVTGGATLELEELLSEGSGIQGAYLTPETLSNRDRCRVETMRLDISPYKQLFCDEITYGTLFMKCFKEYGILCFGLYRLIDDNNGTNFYQVSNVKNRFVLTNPSPDTRLFNNDWVFCLRPFNIDLYNKFNIMSSEATPSKGKMTAV